MPGPTSAEREATSSSESGEHVIEDDLEAEAAKAKAKAKANAKAGKGKGDDEPLSPRHVKAAAKVLAREAKKILKKHANRIAADPAAQMRDAVAKIEELRGTDDHAALEEQAKRLDELLHRHAGFARKSALRETAENIAIAIIIALGLRSCLYEPFKIPSGSMMPTLRAGDHIFVNKFTYGVQIPFTTTIVGESFGDIERGDVIVFRYPLDETEDFIKRVIGLPGDEIRVVGRQVAIKRAGESQFEVLERERLNQRCYDDAGVKQIANCTLYQETLDGHTYTVRYVLNADERNELSAGKPRVWKVPERHLLVMGDNRNRSHDSLQWTVQVEAVVAEKLLTSKDLRDLTDERLFEMQRAGDEVEDGSLSDPHYDRVSYTASHRSKRHDLGLQVWREPALSAAAVYQTMVARDEGATPTTLTELTGKAPSKQVSAERRAELAERVTAMVTASDDDGRHAVVQLSDPEAVLRMSCGLSICPEPADLGSRLTEVLDRFVGNPQQEARLMLDRSPTATYSSHWSARHNPKDHYWERRFAKGASEPGPELGVRLRAFRTPEDGVELVRDAALAEVSASVETAMQVELEGDTEAEAWVVRRDDAWTYVEVDHSREFAFVLSCGTAVCKSDARITELGQTVHGRVPEAAGDRLRMVDLLGPKDLGGLPETPVAIPELYEYDEVVLEATVRDEAYSFELEAWLQPESGLSSKVAAVRDTIAAGEMSEDDSVAEGGFYGHVADGEGKGHTFVFAVPQTEVVLRVTCRDGLCPNETTARALAQRAATTALDPGFIDEDAERPQPFVPRGNVKGRAERIWLPLSRFWLPIR